MKTLRTSCRKCNFPFDHANTVYEINSSGYPVRKCRNCKNWARRAREARRAGRPVPQRPRIVADHSTCEPGGELCAECSAIWRDAARATANEMRGAQ